MNEVKATVRVGSRGRITIPQCIMSAVEAAGPFEKNAHYVLKTYGTKHYWQRPVPSRRITLPTGFVEGENVELTYNFKKGRFINVRVATGAFASNF